MNGSVVERQGGGRAVVHEPFGKLVIGTRPKKGRGRSYRIRIACVVVGFFFQGLGRWGGEGRARRRGREVRIMDKRPELKVRERKREII